MKKTMAIYTLAVLLSVSVSAQKEKKDKTDKSSSSSMKVKKAQADSNHVVLISTNMGDMKVLLYNVTPKHRDNFLKLVGDHFYDSLLFHRVIANFMIQGGDPQSKNSPPGTALGMGENGYTVPAEFVDTLYHRKGALCAARTENPAKASSGCQFYIVQGQVMTNEQVNMMEMQRGRKLTEGQKKAYTTEGGVPHLDGAYTVFGQVIEGMEVLDKIAAVKTAQGDRPLENVYILSMKQLK